MKKHLILSLLFTTLVSAPAFAHGSRAVQASSAMTSAMALLETRETKETLRTLESVSVTWIARETFRVVATFPGARAVSAVCRENEEVDPVAWECSAE